MDSSIFEHVSSENLRDNSAKLKTYPKFKIYGSNLSKDVPAVLYLGDKSEQLWDGLQHTGVRLLPISLSCVTSHFELYQLVRRAACYIFDYVTNGGIYFVGHGLGALLIGKLLADQDIFMKQSRLERLQAAFLISGIYKIDNQEIVDSVLHKFNMTCDEVDQISPLFDNFDHLWKPRTRLYVFTAEMDTPNLRAQSRQMFDRLAESCDQTEMFYETKMKVKGNDILEQMCTPSNFLSRLIRYDIALSQTR